MASITIRQLEENTKRKLRMRAALHGRSMEQEAREILKTALNQPEEQPDRFGEIRLLLRLVQGGLQDFARFLFHRAAMQGGAHAELAFGVLFKLANCDAGHTSMIALMSMIAQSQAFFKGFPASPSSRTVHARFLSGALTRFRPPAFSWRHRCGLLFPGSA